MTRSPDAEPGLVFSCDFSIGDNDPPDSWDIIFCPRPLRPMRNIYQSTGLERKQFVTDLN